MRTCRVRINNGKVCPVLGNFDLKLLCPNTTFRKCLNRLFFPDLQKRWTKVFWK